MLTRDKFAPILKIVLDSSVTPKTIQNVFRASGLYPWNSDAIDYSKCLGRSTSTHIALDNMSDSVSNPFVVFSEIVGNSRLLQFAEMERENVSNDSAIMSSDATCLYQLYKKFKPILTNNISDDQCIDPISNEDNITDVLEFTPADISTNNISDDKCIWIDPIPNQDNIMDVLEITPADVSTYNISDDQRIVSISNQDNIMDVLEFTPADISNMAIIIENIEISRRPSPNLRWIYQTI